MEQPKYKAINFDLHFKSLEIYYSDRNPNGAYAKIQAYMEQNGFEHRQYSGYLSKNKISDSKVNNIIVKMVKKFPWLPHCANRLDVTDIGENFDYMSVLERYKKKGHNMMKEPIKDVQQKGKKNKPEKAIRKNMEFQR